MRIKLQAVYLCWASVVNVSQSRQAIAQFLQARLCEERNIEFCERDDRMEESFRHAGKVTGVTDGFLNEIGKHTYVIYIYGETGNMDEAKHIAFAGAAILKAGGLGIKIETAGKAFEKNKWLGFIETFKPAYLYKMFVVDSIINMDGTVYSCGMHNLGYMDTIISGEEFQKAVGLISMFGYYQIIDKPTILKGQTFSTEIGSPRYRIMEEQNQPNKGHELFENPLGMWRLTRMDSPKQ